MLCDHLISDLSSTDVTPGFKGVPQVLHQGTEKRKCCVCALGGIVLESLSNRDALYCCKAMSEVHICMCTHTCPRKGAEAIAFYMTFLSSNVKMVQHVLTTSLLTNIPSTQQHLHWCLLHLLSSLWNAHKNAGVSFRAAAFCASYASKECIKSTGFIQLVSRKK